MLLLKNYLILINQLQVLLIGQKNSLIIKSMITLKHWKAKFAYDYDTLKIEQKQDIDKYFNISIS